MEQTPLITCGIQVMKGNPCEQHHAPLGAVVCVGAPLLSLVLLE